MSPMSHSGHDYDHLQKRWEALVARLGWKSTVLLEDSGHPVLAIENEAARRNEGGGIYLSAGVHGDECAPVWGLLEWAEESVESLSDDEPLVILPCLNPYGLVENTRRTQQGVDLNRHFQDKTVPLIERWQRYLEGRYFDLAVNLHEDFDAGGIYLYELTRSDSPGDALLAVCEGIIPRETSSTVDGSDFENGLLKRETTEAEIQRVVDEDLDGWPEAIYLYMNHSKDAYTFETPSEMDLERRIEAHRVFLSAVIPK